MNGIFYFSATGNSRYIAEKLQEELGGEIVYISKFSGELGEYERVIIVSPIYSWGLPVPVEGFLRENRSDAPLYIVLNYGGYAGSGCHYAYNVAAGSGWSVAAVYKMKMPENFTLTLSVPQAMVRSMLKKSGKSAERIAQKIKRGQKSLPAKPLLNLEKTHLKNKGNWHLIARDFLVNESCTHCGKCIAICPVQNVAEDSDGNIVFGDRCIACLGCYHRCAPRAINYKKNTPQKPRYVNPNVNEDDITDARGDAQVL